MEKNPVGKPNEEILVYRIWDNLQGCYINGVWERVPLAGFNATHVHPDNCETHEFTIVRTPNVLDKKGHPILKFEQIR